MDTTILLNSGLISFTTALTATSGEGIIKSVTQILDNRIVTIWSVVKEIDLDSVLKKNIVYDT